MSLLQAMQFAEYLTLQDNTTALTDWLLVTISEHWQPQGIILGLCDHSGRFLECSGHHPAGEFRLVLPMDELGHLLAAVVHGKAPQFWKNLPEDMQNEHPGFRDLLMTMNTTAGLLALPVCDEKQKITGVLGVFDEPDVLQRLLDSELPGRLLRLFILQHSRLHQVQYHQNANQCLRDPLDNVTDGLSEHDRLTLMLETRLVGQSSAIQKLRERIRNAAAHSLSVLVEGETGTGKEVVAQLVHECSSRAGQQIVMLNCAAVPENLIESELFGWQKGAFTGAHSNKDGLIARANGGTLFLDEVGDMSLIMQAKLLRVLETREYRPLGGDKEKYSDFRVIAATHRALRQRVADGYFRQDLYYRLCQSEILVPPLREHPEDIPLLCRHFIDTFSERDNRRPGKICLVSLRPLLAYSFPGNVRELRNMVEVACAFSYDGQTIDVQVPLSASSDICSPAGASEPDDYPYIRDLREAVQSFEAGVIRSRLAFFSGDRKRVAESLNIPRRTLDHKCQKLDRA